MPSISANREHEGKPVTMVLSWERRRAPMPQLCPHFGSGHAEQVPRNWLEFRYRYRTRRSQAAFDYVPASFRRCRHVQPRFAAVRLRRDAEPSRQAGAHHSCAHAKEFCRRVVRFSMRSLKVRAELPTVYAAAKSHAACQTLRQNFKASLQPLNEQNSEPIVH